MAGHWSSFPLRLQQILSGGRPVSPALKLESEPPPEVKAFIDRVIKTPLHDIAIPLSGFHWEYNKGNFHHWRPLFMHFDTYFKTYLSCRKDLLLSDNISEEDPFPKHSVMQILRVMQVILENCHNKSSFGGLEHFRLLLASTDPEILIAALETLSALVKINPSKIHVSGKLIACGSVNSCCLSLAQGWGSKEEGLGLHSCVVANERNQHDGLCLFPSDVENKCPGAQYHLGSTLHFEYNMVASQDTEQTSRSKSSNMCVIHIPDLHLRKEDDLIILKQCTDQFNVPPEHRFSLLTRIRYAHALHSLRTCRLYSRIMVLAFIVLVQSNDAQDELVSFFANEPEYANELMRLVRSEDSVPGTIRALAMVALGAQLAAYASSHERARILSSSTIISAGGNRMVLLSILQKAVLSLSNPGDPSTPLFVDALLQFFLLHVLSSSSSGNAIRGSGMVPPLLPLLQDSDPAHTHLVCSAVKTLQKLMEYSSPAVSLFKDLGGVELLAQRLQIEVHRVIGTVGENSNTMISGDLKSDEDHVYSQKRLIKALLKALGSATYSPANSTRLQSSHDNSLPASLSLIFHNVNKFGGDIYFSAVTVMSEIIHKDPTCFPVLNESGLPDSFLSSVISGILPSSKALICVPNGLGAICLNAKGLEAVRETTALQFLVDTFTTRKYLVAMNEGVVLLANAVEELLRHVSSLRSTGVDIIIEIINKLASMGKDKCKDPSGSLDENTVMETDLDNKLNKGHDLVGAMDSAADGISNEQFVQLCIFHVMVLVQRTTENSETCRLFVEKGGIEKLLKLLLQPSITQSSEGMPIALHSSIVFKGFTLHHSAPLAHAFSSSLREHLKKALSGFSSVAGSFLLAPKSTPDNGIFSSLFVVEFILFLAASKDNRWISALLTEFGDASRDVLEDLGRVHQEVLWQVALYEDSKIDADAESSNSVNEAKRSEAEASESDEQRFSSFRQYLDPLLRRRVSGWSIESQVSDLISIYRDLGRAASGLQRLGMDGHSTLRLASGSHSQSSNSVDANATMEAEEDKQRSYYSSCREMMRSLSYHISHLFMELGKAMLLASRRENNPINVSTTGVSVVGTVAAIVLEHLNFGGHASPNMEISISTKCRYLGKVIAFIDGILSDRPESCNPIMLNCFYGRGVIHAILTTFEATSQLLFAVNRVPASPMETDDKSLKEEKGDVDNSWLYGPLANYGTLMDHLVTSSFILSSSTKQLLEQPIANGDVPFPQDAEAFVKVLQLKVLKTVLPIWTHPHFAECDTEFISTMISIMRHVYSGVEVRNVSGIAGARLSGPPPDESAISMIVEMGFSRARAEEALRQVGTNSVEIATDWLFSHPEEPQEDAELARALAMSLGNSDASSKEDEAAISNSFDQEEESVQLPPVDEILSACIRLLQVKEPIAFPVRDLLVMISSQNDGQYRSKVLNFIIDHVKHCPMASDPFNSSTLSALFHVLSLILHEDVVARELASQAGLVKIALNLLSEWNLGLQVGEKSQVPKWVTVCFLSIDRMLRVDPKLTSEFTNLEQLKKDDPNTQTPVVIGESKGKDSQSTLGSITGLLDMQDQKRLLEICCRCIQNQLPSYTMHVVLRLCATLTKVHSVAVGFLDAGGLHALLNLPTSSLFSGFNNVASAIVRHILEDPHTLQLAMESEIRHTLHSSARVAPRNFVQNLAFVISRDPVVFMKAAHAVCQIEMVGDRPYVVLLKDREKEKEKSKEKEKDKAIEKDKSPAADGKFTAGDVNPMAPGSGHGKLPDSNAKNTKPHRKSPQSFTMAIEHLLNLIVTFVPSLKVEDQFDGVPGTPSVADMDVDCTSAKGKGKAIAVSSEDSKIASQEASASLAKTAFILKLLTEILLTYTSSIHVLLRRDVEVSSFHRPVRGSSADSSGGILQHILHKFLPYPGIHKKDKKADGDWRHKLATRANQFLVASSIRSTEGRKRIFSEISNVFNNFIDSSSGCSYPDSSMHAFVDLLNDILAARSPTGTFISAEASATFIDVGLVQSLTRTLQILDLDHADSPKIVTGIVKALETVSREYVHSADLNAAKGDTSLKLASDQNHVDSSYTYSSGGGFQLLETTSQHDHTEGVSGHVESFNAAQNSGSSDSITDDMDHDRDLDGGFARESEDDFMHEASEDGAGNENGMSPMEIRFDIPRNAEDEMGDEDDDMSGDDGDEVDEDDEDNIDLEEDDLHQMSHPDTDQDEHEVDDEEFDEDGLEEEDDDDDEDDDEVILRLEEGFNGINVFDHIEVFGGNNFSRETLGVMPLDIFGSRRQGRTTSIYNLLGRAGDHGIHLEHPLLEDPSSFRHFVHQRQTVDMAFSDINHESTSRSDAIFRSLRSGHHGRHRFNMWLDDSQQHGGLSAPAVPPVIEELLVSQLRRPTPVQPSDQNVSTDNPQEKDEPNQLQRLDAGLREETITGGGENNENMIIPSPSSVVDGTGNGGVGPADVAALQERETSNANEQVDDMQYERSDAAIRDVEAVSQASSGSGATLGESLRSLEVEIGSADGHDDGERQGPADRLPLGDLQPSTRVRRSLGSTMPIGSRDTSLESVSELPQHPPSQEAGQSGPHEEQQPNRNVDTDAIDPTFLEALPEDLRAEVLSSQQNQVTQTSSEHSQTVGEIDPEFLAALPPDIREEVLAQQRAQRLQQSQELEGQPVEMDAVSIIATFPSEIREEVLLTSPDTLLATLTPALVAEANMLRERFAHRRYSGTLFGMNSRNRRGESSRHGDTIGSSLGRITGDVARKSAAGKLIEADGAPLVDTDALKTLIRLLRVVQPLYKGQLQRLLLNLCAHHETRMSLVKILMDMLMLDLRGATDNSVDAAEPLYRLYGCQSYIAYSRPQFSNGVPPIVSRRILETLTYLARHHLNVAKLLLHLELAQPPLHKADASDQGHGKAVIMEEDKPEDKKGDFAIALLLSLLNQPLYMRSVAHLEQLLNLLEVIMVNAENDSGVSNKSGESPDQPSSDSTMQDELMNTDAVGLSAGGNGKSFKAEDSNRNSVSAVNNKCSIRVVLLSLPQAELRLLCSLLAHEGLSDNAYVLVAEVLKKIVIVAPSYCSLFITELAISLQNLTLCALNELRLYVDAEKAVLSTSSTNGTAILRVLQALSSLVAALHEKKDPGLLPDREYASALSQIWDINAALESLWVELSNCISKIESSSESQSDLAAVSGNLASTAAGVAPPLPAGTQNILPYIESFFVTCEKLFPGQSEAVQEFAATASPDIEDSTTSTSGKKSSGTYQNVDEKHVAFVKFSEKHRKLLNAFVRQNPGLLEKSFSLMLKVPRFIDFDNKRAYFRSKIKHQHDHHHNPVRISVRRAYILEDSYNQLRMRSPQDLKGRLTVHFQREEGIDAGGLTREWYQLLSRVIFDKGALLFTTVGNESTFQPNPNSVYQTEHLSYFKFVGRVVGKALFDGQLLDVHFTRSFYKHILGVKVTYHDIEAVDPDYYKSLKWILENDKSDVLDLTFSIDADEEKLILYEKSEVTDCELIPGGRNIRVTEENKHEYVDRLAEHRLTTAIRPQINAFMEGFTELIPRDLISIFNDKELELLISGLPDIDLDDLRANTEYFGYSNASPVIQWFWEVLQGFSKEDKARFLQFVTGTSKVPLEGFSALQGISGAQKFQIHKAYGSPHHLPSAHTCFNQLDLPEYTSKEQLQERLLLAVHEANEGFGFG
ncbi:E3 ubiquitin-protein ligase UPL2-like isoform X2 [Phoenix dactylifera]|uniref:HECT-type E3 ubiquitin transferase n=1 Tax=Phoenix dactylifera TaxID=42345 RepID=A0A8B8J6H4_PHODC|nr:E3 ubiquitin-protein ligase UPL2-like isoform X2 [Phoenix dactylifera]